MPPHGQKDHLARVVPSLEWIAGRDWHRSNISAGGVQNFAMEPYVPSATTSGTVSATIWIPCWPNTVDSDRDSTLGMNRTITQACRNLTQYSAVRPEWLRTRLEQRMPEIAACQLDLSPAAPTATIRS